MTPLFRSRSAGPGALPPGGARFFRPRDSRAEQIPARFGADRAAGSRTVLVAGGGIAGLAAAAALAERGISVVLAEPEEQLGGRVRSWPVRDEAGSQVSDPGEPRGAVPDAGPSAGRAPSRTMGRGFHAFFRQYYNLRKLLERLPAEAPGLVPVPDYPLVAANGLADSFARIPRRPPWSFIGFVLASPSFRLRDLLRVDVDAALSLLDTDFPRTFREHDGRDAAGFLDSLGFPARARHLALEVFARSFFADPREFSAGELVGMFHTYFLGSAEGLLFDTAADDFDTALWAPLGRYLEGLGVRRRRARVRDLDFRPDRPTARLEPVGADGSSEDVVPESFDAVVLAAGPGAVREIVASASGLRDPAWRRAVAAQRNAPPFAVWRLWLDRPVEEDRPAFLGTAGFGPLDNLSVLERFEAGAAAWRAEHGGSVVELHAYALDDADAADAAGLRAALRHEMGRIWPETLEAEILHEELLVEDDCPLIGTGPWQERPGVRTPDPRLVLAGDQIRCELPVALMERAATTGWQAANALLGQWGIAGHELLSPPTRGPAWSGILRGLLRRLPGRAPAADGEGRR